MRNMDCGLTGLLSASDREVHFDALAGHGALKLVWHPVWAVRYVSLGFGQFATSLIALYGVAGHTEYLGDLVCVKAFFL